MPSDWLDTELWNFSHSLAIDLRCDDRGEKETLIYRAMRAAISAYSLLAVDSTEEREP